MTRANFARLSDELCEQPIMSYEILNHITKCVYDTAMVTSAFDMCTDLCLQLTARLCTMKFIGYAQDLDNDEHYWTIEGATQGPFRDKVTAEENARKMNSFKRLLLNQCQLEFESKPSVAHYEVEIKELRKLKGILEEREYESSLQDLLTARRRYLLGNVIFIGHLYVKNLFPRGAIIHECLCYLSRIKFTDRESWVTIASINDPDEEDVERFCKLLETVGQTLEQTPSGSSKLDAYLARVTELGESTTYSFSVRLMCKDTVDLRQRKWAPFYI